jgi:hypothetical protein
VSGDPGVEIELLAEPRVLAMRERGRFEAGFVVSNTGATTVDPLLHLARLLINGEDSLQWGEAVGNGLREEEWFALPPGRSFSASWSSLGEVFFPAPGDYTLQIRLGAAESALAVVRVEP